MIADGEDTVVFVENLVTFLNRGKSKPAFARIRSRKSSEDCRPGNGLSPRRRFFSIRNPDCGPWFKRSIDTDNPKISIQMGKSKGFWH